jgi:acetolactate synthase-1/3 small subunit
MKKEDDHTYTLHVSVRNRPGVLVRCAQVFGRRGHNIEALHVTPNPDDVDLANMKITAYGERAMMNQIVAQLRKLPDVAGLQEEER